MDAETVGLAQALRHPNVTLMEGARVRRLLAGAMAGLVAWRWSRTGGGR
jgi:hypothetical protein